MAAIPVGSGSVDLYGYARKSGDYQAAGAGARYEHRVKANLSLFGQAEVGRAEIFGAPQLEYSALGGLRWRF